MHCLPKFQYKIYNSNNKKNKEKTKKKQRKNKKKQRKNKKRQKWRQYIWMTQERHKQLDAFCADKTSLLSVSKTSLIFVFYFNLFCSFFWSNVFWVVFLRDICIMWNIYLDILSGRWIWKNIKVKNLSWKYIKMQCFVSLSNHSDVRLKVHFVSLKRPQIEFKDFSNNKKIGKRIKIKKTINNWWWNNMLQQNAGRRRHISHNSSFLNTSWKVCRCQMNNIFVLFIFFSIFILKYFWTQHHSFHRFHYHLFIIFFIIHIFWLFSYFSYLHPSYFLILS